MKSDPSINPIACAFLSAFFHEDWLGESPTEHGILVLYVSQSKSKSEVLDVAKALNDVAIENEQSKDDNWLLTQYGCYFRPAAVGLSAPEWVKKVANDLVDLTKRGKPI